MDIRTHTHTHSHTARLNIQYAYIMSIIIHTMKKSLNENSGYKTLHFGYLAKLMYMDLQWIRLKVGRQAAIQSFGKYRKTKLNCLNPLTLMQHRWNSAAIPFRFWSTFAAVVVAARWFVNWNKNESLRRMSHNVCMEYLNFALIGNSMVTGDNVMNWTKTQQRRMHPLSFLLFLELDLMLHDKCHARTKTNWKKVPVLFSIE